MKTLNRIQRHLILASVINWLLQPATGNYEVYNLDDSQFCRKNGNVIQLGAEPYRSSAVFRAVHPSLAATAGYRTNIKCSVTVKAPPKMGLTLVIAHVDLRDGSTASRDNKKPFGPDELTIQMTSANTVRSFSGSLPSSRFKREVHASPPDENVLITFTSTASKDSTHRKNFLLFLTTYHPVDGLGKCPASDDQLIENGNPSSTSVWFDCQDGRCVHSNFKCDSVTNCVNGQDENDKDCGRWYAKNRKFFWALFFIGWIVAAFFIILTIVVSIFCRNKLTMLCC